MGGIVSLANYQPDNPQNILSQNPSLTTESSWNTIYTTSQNIINPNVLFSEVYSISGYPANIPYVKPYNIIRPITGLILPFVQVAIPSLNVLGNSNISTLSVIEDTTPGSEVIDICIKSNFLDYQTEGSITSDGILTESFTVTESFGTLSNFPGFIVKNTNQTNEVAGANVTITYDMMAYSILITRVPGGASSDTLDSVANIIADNDFNMANQSTNSSFKFFIKNTDAVDNITLLPGAGWSFVSFTILPKNTMCFMAIINYNAATADLLRITEMVSVP